MLRAWFMALLVLPIAAAVLPPGTGALEPLPDVMDVPYAVQITTGGGALSFRQVDFHVRETVLEFTPWGELQADAQALAMATGIAEGYLNVVTPVGWVVWNLHVRYLPEAPATSSARLDVPRVEPTAPRFVHAAFDLGRSPTGGPPGPIRELPARVLFSPLPIVEEPTLTQLMAMNAPQPSNFPVSRVVHTPGGDEERTARSPPFDPGMPPLVGPPKNVGPALDLPLAAPVWWLQEATANVHSAHNQCVPAAQANALQYLENLWGFMPFERFAVPHANVFGWGGSGSITGQLDAFMNRGVISASSGSGTGTQQAFTGLTGYLKSIETAPFPFQNGLDYDDVTFRHVGRDAQYSGAAGKTTQRQLAEPTWDWICDRVKDGDAIVISYGFYDAQGVRTGGHQVRIYGCGLINGVRYLLQLDDSAQTNSDPMNVNGLRWIQRWVFDGDNDGRLNLDGGNTEIEYALAMRYLPNLGT